MKLTQEMFPTTTIRLFMRFPQVSPDAIRRALVLNQQHGRIRKVGGLWRLIPRDKDESERAVYGSQRYMPGKPRVPRKPCKQCGEPTVRPRGLFCCYECSVKFKTKPRPKCKQCGATCRKISHSFCSKECVNKAKVGGRREGKL